MDVGIYEGRKEKRKQDCAVNKNRRFRNELRLMEGRFVLKNQKKY
jgi:hypothetical protein